ncbi:MAG: cell division protein ZipA [Pseudoxanthomonas suwonensis]|nr:cell division protein ZipA [Pseudoxanthomonas suwonensis]
MSDTLLLRLGILIAGALLMLAIYVFGRPRKGAQGRKREAAGRKGTRDGRQEPSLGEEIERDLVAEDVVQGEIELQDSGQPASELGKRVSDDYDKIITLYVAARAGQILHGPDIVVAAEKAGLTWGYMQVFHRLLEGHPQKGPVFSVANVVKPGSFDMANVQDVQTPAIAFFLTLPAPVGALDAWEMMEPAAQRMSELLDGVLLDESRNALSRQRIQMIREEMRAWDRQNDAPPLTRTNRW